MTPSQSSPIVKHRPIVDPMSAASTKANMHPSTLTFVLIKPIQQFTKQAAIGNQSFCTCGSTSIDGDHSVQCQTSHNSTLKNDVYNKLKGWCSVFNVDFEVENVSFRNDYMIKFNVHFKFANLKHELFAAFIETLFKELAGNSANSFIIEFSLDVVNCLNKQFELASTLNNYYRFKLTGFSLGSLSNLSKFFCHFSVNSHTKPLAKNSMQIEFKYSKKCLVLYFPINNNRQRLYKLVVSFSSIKTLILELLNNTKRVHVELIYSPMLFYTELDPKKQQQILSEKVNFFDLQLLWKRDVNFNQSPVMAPYSQPSAKSKQRFYETALSSECVTEYDAHLLGMSKSFFFELSNKCNILENLIFLVNICKSLNKNFSFYMSNVLIKNSTVDYGFIKNLLNQKFSFSIYYACLALFSNSYKIADELKDDNNLFNFIDLIERESFVNKKLVEHCLYYLKIQSRECYILNIYYEFLKKIKELGRILDLDQSKVHSGYVLIRRAILSPTHLELCQPIPLLKSRFSNIANVDYAIRLNILDDNNRKLNNCKTKEDFDFIKNIIKTKLMQGIKIGDRLYDFLGSSSSQMRENGVIMYAKDNCDQTAQTIRDLAGDLSKFNHDVAKYVARFGLMFSQAMAHFESEQVATYIIKDFLGDVKPNFKNYINFKKEKHIFSDGVGIISKSVAAQILPYLHLKSKGYFPSAFQIRYGGCKGMLVVYDMAKPAIIFRDSMKKYESSDTALGILKFSAPRPVFLNRPLITILDQLNVEKEVFYHYFNQSTSIVAKASLFDVYALRLAKTYSNSYLPYDRIYRSGISLLKETFFRNIVNYLIYYRLNELKVKARIRIPYSNGRIAFGVIDESRSLNYGEVYFQYTKMSKDGTFTLETDVLEGEIMVTKFPCLQPGDVRKLRAVNVPSLSHIKDCIVFPSKGKRPHPDEMGGSDLDGDEYALFWNTKLIFPLDNFDSMTFPYGMTKHQTDDITIDDIVDFYCNYLLYNNIGQVANCHLMYADFHPKGLFSDECTELAVQYSISLDYQKTGYLLNLPKKYILKIRPDFMEKFITCKIYLSKNILGQFYRHCCLIEKMIDLSYHNKFSYNDLECTGSKSKFLILDDWRKYYAEAEEAFLEYKLQIVEIMEQLDVGCEIVLLSDVYEDKSDVAKVLIMNLFNYFQSKFKSQCAKLNCSPENRLLLASAWYAICFERSLFFNQKPLIGLPWTIPDEMCALAQLHKSRHNVGGDDMVLNNGNQLEEEASEETNDDEELSSNEQITTRSNELNNKLWPNLSHRKPTNIVWPTDLDVEKINLNVTLKLIMYWINKIKCTIYEWSDSKTIELPVDIMKKTISVNKVHCAVSSSSNTASIREDKYLQYFILGKLKSIYDKRDKSNDLGEYGSSVSFLFNSFMMYLFETCHSANYCIQKGRIEEILLVRYAMFSLVFMNKLDSQQDNKFYCSIDLANYDAFKHKYEDYDISDEDYDDQDSDGNCTVGCQNTNQSSYAKVAEVKCQSKATDNMSANSNVYRKYLDILFDSYVSKANLLKETCKFYMLQNNTKFNLKQLNKHFEKKMRFLSGVFSIEVNKDLEHNISVVTDDRGTTNESSTSSQSQFGAHFTAATGNQKTGQQGKHHKSMPTESYQLKVTGLTHSISILRLLLGHPDFYDNIYTKFDVLDVAQVKSEK